MFSDRDRQRLHDIVDNADRIARYLGERGYDEFVADERTIDAVERCLQRVTEAVIQLGSAMVDKARLSVPWHDVRNLGNRLRHDYARIEPQVIYQTVTMDIPALRQAALQALER